MVEACLTTYGDRRCAVCRELTKKFEEIQRDTLENLAETYQAQTPKGEVVVLIDRSRSESVNHLDLETDLQRALKEMSMRDAVDLVAQAHGLPRRQVYQAALALGKS